MSDGWGLYAGSENSEEMSLVLLRLRFVNCVAGTVTDVCDDDNSLVGTNYDNRGVLDSYRQYDWIS